MSNLKIERNGFSSSGDKLDLWDTKSFDLRKHLELRYSTEEIRKPNELVANKWPITDLLLKIAAIAR